MRFRHVATSWLCLGSMLASVTSPLIADTANQVDAAVQIDLGNGQTVELLTVKPATFMQGSLADEAGREDDELQHKVTLTKEFLISKYPITVGQFRRFVEEAGYKTEAESGPSGGFGLVGDKLEQRPEFNWKNPGYAVTDQHPVTIVTVADAIAFNAWLSRKAGRTIQLPSESQWEFACRAGSDSRFYSGNSDADFDAIGWSKQNAMSAMPVGQKQPNAWGLYDMSGNVYEWCGDFYGSYGSEDAIDPQVRTAPSGQPARVVLRGGSYLRFPKRCRSAARYRADSGTRNAENGFRVVALITAPSDTPPANAEQPAPPVYPSSPASNSPTGHTDASGHAYAQVDPTHGNANDHQTHSGLRFLPFGMLCLFGFGAIALGVLALTFLRRVPRLQSQPIPPTAPIDSFMVNPQPQSMRLVHDGFWLNTVDYMLGSTIFYHYLVANQRIDGSVVVDTDNEQFVYTGNKPNGIAIDAVELPDASRGGNRRGGTRGGSKRSGRHTDNRSSTYADDDREETGPEENEEETSSDRALLSDREATGFPPAY